MSTIFRSCIEMPSKTKKKRPSARQSRDKMLPSLQLSAKLGRAKPKLCGLTFFFLQRSQMSSCQLLLLCTRQMFVASTVLCNRGLRAAILMIAGCSIIGSMPELTAASTAASEVVSNALGSHELRPVPCQQ